MRREERGRADDGRDAVAPDADRLDEVEEGHGRERVRPGAGHAGRVDALPNTDGGAVLAQPFRVVKQATSSSNLASSSGLGALRALPMRRRLHACSARRRPSLNCTKSSLPSTKKEGHGCSPLLA